MATRDTVLGIEENLEAVLAYVGIWITGIIFLAVEKDNKFVRFHAMQSLITFLALFVLSIVVGIIPLIGWLISILITPVGVVLWVWLMYKAYSGEMYKLPVVGELAADQVFSRTDGAGGDETEIVDVEPSEPVGEETGDEEPGKGETGGSGTEEEEERG